MYLLELEFSLDKCPEVELQDYLVDLCLPCEEPPYCSHHSGYTSLYSYQQC